MVLFTGIHHIVFLLSSSSSVVSKIVTTVKQESNVTLTVSAAPSVLVKNDSNELSPVSTAPTVQPTTASVSLLDEQEKVKFVILSEKEDIFMKHRTFSLNASNY